MKNTLLTLLFLALALCAPALKQKLTRRLKKYKVLSKKDTAELTIDSTQIEEVTTEAYLSLEGMKLTLSATPVENACAHARFRDTIMEKGWDTLNMHISAECDNEAGFFAIGYLEGLLSYTKIRYLWRSYIGKFHYKVEHYSCSGDDNPTLKRSYALMNRIDAKMKEVIKKVGGKQDEMTHKTVAQLAKLYAQQQGIMKGFNDYAGTQSKSFEMTLEMLMIINYDGGIDNVREMVGGGDGDRRFHKLMRLKKSAKLKSHARDFLEYMRKAMRSKCSVLFKRVGKSDIVMSHSTWDTYWAMQRVFKYLAIEGKKSITYSSYPGCISSTDDFFLVDGNMMVTETSLDFSLSPEDQQTMFSPGYNYIPEYFKIMAANHLATSGLSWIQHVQLFKSAIYYSQWMVFDLNRFETLVSTGTVDPANAALYVIEDGFAREDTQAVSQDAQLLKAGYFASYNEKLIDGQMPPNARRYTAFANNQKKIDGLDKLKEVMQHNEQLMDDKLYPDVSEKEQRLKEKQAYASIALRMDTIMGQDGGFGAIDIKVTNAQMIRENSCYAKNGPVMDAGRKFFVWNTPPEGQPKKWKFRWEEMGPQL